MSRQFRYRMAAVTLSGLIFGLPLLTNGTASAEQVEPAGRQVSFGGGVLGLSCESRPSVESMTVPADTVVRVVNRTGHDARLRLGGTARGTVPEDGSAELVFRRGTTAVLLTPDCAQGDEVLPMLVTAEPSASSTPGEPPSASAAGSASTMMAKPSGPGSPAGSQSGSTLPDSVSPDARPARTSPDQIRSSTRKAAESRPAATVRGAAVETPTMPQGGVSPRIKVKTMRGTEGVGAPAFAGMPLGDRKTLLPATSGTSIPAAAAVASHGAEAAAPTAPTAEGVPVMEAVEPGAGAGAVAEPVAAVGPIRDGRPVGLLGLTALICVLGVSTAAIRAIVSQRASRTNMA
ncbi:hypothetical protein [Actinoplanes sp. GCM10030250]|uniref:hypothetical protein n=1 Tax=Actinoplanes sp. GCM10030250 TaxID=3273376 RepID=UPI00361FF42C